MERNTWWSMPTHKYHHKRKSNLFVHHWALELRILTGGWIWRLVMRLTLIIKCGTEGQSLDSKWRMGLSEFVSHSRCTAQPDQKWINTVNAMMVFSSKRTNVTMSHRIVSNKQVQWHADFVYTHWQLSNLWLTTLMTWYSDNSTHSINSVR